MLRERLDICLETTKQRFIYILKKLESLELRLEARSAIVRSQQDQSTLTDAASHD